MITIDSKKREFMAEKVYESVKELGLENFLGNDLLRKYLYVIIGRCMACYGGSKRCDLSETRKDLGRAIEECKDFDKIFAKAAKKLCHKCEENEAPIPSVFALTLYFKPKTYINPD